MHWRVLFERIWHNIRYKKHAKKSCEIICRHAKPFEILNSVLKDIILIPEGHVCTTMMKLFNEEGILVEPAGALAISALDRFKE